MAIDSPDRFSSRIQPRYVTEVCCLILMSLLLMSSFFLLGFYFFYQKVLILFCPFQNECLVCYQQTSCKEN